MIGTHPRLANVLKIIPHFPVCHFGLFAVSRAPSLLNQNDLIILTKDSTELQFRQEGTNKFSYSVQADPENTKRHLTQAETTFASEGELQHETKEVGFFRIFGEGSLVQLPISCVSATELLILLQKAAVKNWNRQEKRLVSRNSAISLASFDADR